MSRGPYTCCLCGSEEFGYGHNPAPLAGDQNRACDSCNATKVIPARLAMMFPSDREFASEDSHELATAAIVGGIFTVSMGALLEHLGTALNNKDAAAATFFKDCIDYMGMSMVSSYEENTKDFPKEVKYAIDMTLGMTAKQLGEWEADPEFEELTNLGSSEDPDVDTMSEVVLDDAQEFEDDFGVMYSAEEEVFKCSCGGNLIIGEPIRYIECDTCGGTDYQAESFATEGKRNTSLKGADLTGYDLTGANLSRADLRDTDLTGADMRDAELNGVKLLRASLRNADLRDTDLTGASLSGSRMIITDLTGADLTGAKMTGVKQAESYADFFTQMEELLESTTIAGGWTLDATTDQEDPDAVTMVVKFKPSDPSTFFDIIE